MFHVAAAGGITVKKNASKDVLGAEVVHGTWCDKWLYDVAVMWQLAKKTIYFLIVNSE